MPNKKKARPSSHAPSTASVQTRRDSVQPSICAEEKPSRRVSPDILNDPWTDEQEIALFKGMIKWKPVGMHKHFHMMALSQHLRNHGFDPQKEPHMRIPAIWEKLRSLYDLKTLDERENSFGEVSSDDSDPARESYSPFRLPQSEFGEMIFERRLATRESSSSPSLSQQSSEGRERKRPSTAEPRSSPAPRRQLKSARGRGISRPSRLRKETTPKTPGKRESKSSIRTSDEDQEDEDEGGDEKDGNEENQSTPTPRTRRGRGRAAAGRGSRGGIGRGSTRRGGRRR